jgi:hypothetical protein
MDGRQIADALIERRLCSKRDSACHPQLRIHGVSSTLNKASHHHSHTVSTADKILRASDSLDRL